MSDTRSEGVKGQGARIEGLAHRKPTSNNNGGNASDAAAVEGVAWSKRSVWLATLTLGMTLVVGLFNAGQTWFDRGSRIEALEKNGERFDNLDRSVTDLSKASEVQRVRLEILQKTADEHGRELEALQASQQKNHFELMLKLQERRAP